VETNDTGIDQCIKDHLLNLQSRFSKHFPEAVSDKYKRIMDPFMLICTKTTTIVSLEENYIDIILT
jgi:hypothetical protein